MLQNRLMPFLTNLSMVLQTIGETRLKRVLILMLFAIPALAGTNYYVSSSGNDANNGTSPATPWKTTNPTSLFGYNWATPHWYQGDSLLFKRGDTISGAFNISASTGIEHPSFIGAYGTGAKPILVGDLRKNTWQAIPGRTGYYKTFVGSSYLYYAYEKINGVYTAVTRAGDVTPDLNTWLNNLAAGCAGPTLIQDTLYYHTHDNGAVGPIVFALQGGMVSGVSNVHPMMIRDLEFQGTSNGIGLSDDISVTVRQIKIRNVCGYGIYDLRGKNNLIDSCRVDTAGYTAYYQTQSERTIFRYDSVNQVTDTVRGVYTHGAEKNAFGSEGTTDYTTGKWTLIEYCWCKNVYGAVDAYYNQSDTTRYCNFYAQEGVFGMGKNIAIYNNTITGQSPTYGRGIDVASDYNVTRVTNNTLINFGMNGGAIDIEANINGGTAIVTGNQVQVYNNGSSRYAYVWTTTGVTMSGNSYCGSGNATWYTGAWPSLKQYATLAAFQTATGLETNSTWSSIAIPLPVEVTSFNAVTKGNTVELDWNTATEVNSYSYVIERRTAAQWESIGEIPAGGTTNAPRSYVYVDSLKNVSSGSIFYRLKSVDTDGGFQYNGEAEVLVTTAVTTVVTTTIPNIYMLSQNYPNPFNPTTTINYQLQKGGSVSLKVYDMRGREVATLVNGEKEAGYYSAMLDGSKLSSGTYIYRLQTGSFTETKKLVLLK
jgi:hypothetical protein